VMKELGVVGVGDLN